MATEVGSDIALIQDEDMLRKMWQQTEDFGKKKEIRMRMYKLREQRLKEFYTTGEMIQTETTSKRSSTRTHTDSIADQGFMTMKSKEIRDSESPTDEYQRQSNNNKNDYVSSKNEISDGNNIITKIEQTNIVKPTEEFISSSFQTSTSSSVESKWESSQTTISVSEEVQKVNVNSSSKFIENEQNNEGRQLTYDTSFNKQINEDRGNLTYDSSFNKQSNEDNSYSTYGASNIKQNNEDRQLTYDNSLNKQESSNIDTKITKLMTSSNVNSVNQEDNYRYSNDHQKHSEVYTNKSNDNNVLESLSNNLSSKNKICVDNMYTSNINSTNKSENFDIKIDNENMNELQKIDSYPSTQKSTTGFSTKPSVTESNEDKIVKTLDDKIIDSSKENTEGQYTTTYKDSYQQPKISVDLSPSHEAFARSLRSTPERSSPSPNRDRFSPERRLKSASPEKYRALSPEKSASPPKSLRSSTRRKLSSTYTKDISKKRANTPTRGEKHDSSDDSDCSAATHGTYDKYKVNSAKRTLFKEETKITATSKYDQKSPSTSPVRREKSPGYSSEGSVGKEVKKTSTKVKNSSHESSPERSAFKPIKNYRMTQSQHETHDNKTNLKLREENDYSNNYKSKIDTDNINNFVKVIKPEVIDDSYENTQLVTESIVSNDQDLKNRSVQEKFIIEEQVYNSSEKVDSEKIAKESTKINKTNREQSPLKELNQQKFIENEKSKEFKDDNKINEVLIVNLKEKTPVKEFKPVIKDVKTHPNVKSSEKVTQSPNKNGTPSKKTISAIPSTVKKPTSPEKPLKKNITHKDSKDNLLHKTVKKDLSREKVDVKITRNDSKTLIHKNSKDSVTPKTVAKKSSQELLIDRKTTISFRNKVNSSETKPKTPESSKVIEKKDSKTKLKPSISPQSSQKKLGIVKSTTDTKSVTEKTNFKKIPSTTVTKPKTFTTAKSNVNETPSKGTKLYSKNTQAVNTKNEIKKTTPSTLNKTIKFEVTKNVELKTNDQIEDQLLPDNFESDSELDDSAENPTYKKNNLSNSSSSSSSSSEDEAEEDKQKIKELDNMRIEAEEEYGKKMTNKDALLNVSVQLPPSSRESSPEFSARFGQPYCSVSDDASLPRYADVVSEPEDVNDFKLNSNRYDVVTDLDEDINITVADRVSKFLHNVNKQEEIKTTEIPQSPQAVKKAKNLFESIAKGQIEETDKNYNVNESETASEVQDSSKVINSQSSLTTKKISGSSDYKTRKEFFEKRTNDEKNHKIDQEKVKPLTPSLARSSSIKDRRASFETKPDKKTPLKDKTNVSRTKSPESKHSFPEKTAKSPTKTVKTEIFDVKVEDIKKSRKLSGSKTVKDRTACFEKNEVNQKAVKENKSAYKYQVPNSSVKTGRISDIYTKSVKVSGSNIDHGSTKRVKSPNRSKKSPQKTVVDHSTNKVTNESASREVSAKSPERKLSKSPDRVQAKSSERSLNTNDDNTGSCRVFDSTISSRQRVTTTNVKTDYGATIKNTTVPKTALTTTKSTSVNNTDDEVPIEEIFDLHVLEIMLEKAVGYDRRRRIRAQIRVVKRELELKNEKEITTTTTTRATKNVRNTSPVKTQKQTNITVEKTEYAKKTVTKNQKSSSPQQSSVNLVSKSRSPSPQKTLRAVEETRSPSTQKPVNDKARSPSPKKTAAAPVEKSRSPSPQKNMSVDKSRSPSPKKMSVAKKQQESRTNKTDNTFQNSAMTSSISKTVTTTSKVKSEQVGTRNFQEQNVTDLITSSYGVGPTDDNGRPLFGLRALRKTNTNQSLTDNDSVRQQFDSCDSVQDNKSRQTFAQKSAENENKGNRASAFQESRTTVVHREAKGTEQRAGVDQLITDHKGKPLFGLRALQSVGKNDGEPVHEDASEPPASPPLRELVLKHEKHVEESSKFDMQPKQKPKAKFRDSFIHDAKDERSSSAFQENGFSDPNSISLRSIIKNSEAYVQNETTVKSKSQSTVFQSKSVMRSDGSGNVSVTRDFLKGEMSSVNDQEPSGKLTRGHYTYQSPDDSDAKKGIAKVTTVTTSIGGKNVAPEITEVTEEFNDSDRVDSNRVVKRSLTNGKFESIQKRFSQESFDQDSRRSSRDANGYEKTDESVSAPRSGLVRGDSIKALQHKFQQATVSSSLKQSKSTKSDSSSSNKRQTEEKTVVTKVNTSKSSGPTSFLDNNSRVTGVQDVLTRMRNADLVVESGDTTEDAEARSLLNKFLGASVILHGMEHEAKSPTSGPKAMTATSASLVNQVEKQRTQKSVVRTNLSEQELDNIWDEKQLKILLESSSDYDQRKKIRARLRQIMAEQKACADVVALANNDNTAAASSKTNQVTESNSTSVSSKNESSSYVKTEVHTRTTSSSYRSTKASNDSSSPFAKFQQLERQNSAPNSQLRPCYKFTDAALTRSASSIKDRLLSWVKAQTKEYKNLQITNFSTSWSDGLAFCALIHHFYPEAFDYDKLKPENRRENFEIAFRVAEDEAGIVPLLDVEDMVVMRKPDWKCVFTYVQTFYRRFHNISQTAKSPC